MARSHIGLCPISRRAANEAIERWHSHHGPVVQCCWALGAFVDRELVGVAVVESPKTNELRKQGALEVTRLACDGRTPHAATRLLGRVAQDALATPFCRRLVSYTRIDERGTCYRAAGWRPVSIVKGREWSGVNKPGRWLPGLYEPSTEVVDRVRWEIGPDALPEDPALAHVGRRPSPASPSAPPTIEETYLARLRANHASPIVIAAAEKAVAELAPPPPSEQRCARRDHDCPLETCHGPKWCSQFRPASEDSHG